MIEDKELGTTEQPLVFEFYNTNPTTPKIETYKRKTPKIGRNNPCPCNSGKKYKKCCGSKVKT